MTHKILLLAPMSSVHERFNGACLNALKDLNVELHLCANFSMDVHTKEYAERVQEEGIVVHDLPFVRGALTANLPCIKLMKELFAKENFDIVHAHTETGGILTRLAMSANKKTKYMFTPHGMSFWKGSGLKSQMVYRPIEWWICKAMDMNIAINEEELSVLQKWNKRTATYIHGIGLNVDKVASARCDVSIKKTELRLPLDSKVLLSVGELNNNKNHLTIIDALSKIKNLPANLYYVICGQGDYHDKLIHEAESKGLKDRLVLAGFRRDIYEIMQIADYFVFPSFHEGLPVSVMEAMATGLPIVGSRIRGTTDLIKDGEGGYLYAPTDVAGFAEGLSKLFSDDNFCKQMGEINRRNVLKCDIKSVRNEMFNIYNNLIK